MTEREKRKKMFSALLKVETEPVPEKLTDDIGLRVIEGEIRPDVPTRDEEYEMLKDLGDF